MKHIFTEQELLCSLDQSLHRLCDSVKNKNFTLEQIADDLPCHMHLNRRSDMVMYFLNKSARDYYGDYYEIILNSGAAAMQKVIHPRTTRQVLGPLFELTVSNDTSKVLSFVQYVRRDPDSDYHFFMTNCKLYEPDDSLICITQQASCLDKYARQMLQMLDQDRFYTQNVHKFAGLTRREKQILQHIASGKTNQDIADMLCISKYTVKTHRQNIIKKLETSKLADLIKYAQTFF
mgnify:CR=1 FL=1